MAVCRWSRLPRWLGCFGMLLLVLGQLRVAAAQDYKLDAHASQALTAYLRTHRLPLVGAQVLSDATGARKIVLYGFVASQFGRTDAARKARAYLKTNGVTLENRIIVRPQIAGMKPQPTTAAQSADSGSQSLDQILNDIDRYGVGAPVTEPVSPR